jgi:hypothetical protein
MPSTIRDLAKKAIGVAKDSSSHFLAELGAFIGAPVTFVLDAWKDPLRQFDHIHPRTAPYLQVVNEQGRPADPPGPVLMPQLTQEEVVRTTVERVREAIEAGERETAIHDTLDAFGRSISDPLVQQRDPSGRAHAVQESKTAAIMRLIRVVDERRKAENSAPRDGSDVADQRAANSAIGQAPQVPSDKIRAAQHNMMVSTWYNQLSTRYPTLY